MLGPGAEHRMDNGAALFITRAHQILRVGVHAHLGSHGTNDRDLVRDLSGLGKVLGELSAGFRRNRIARAF